MSSDAAVDLGGATGADRPGASERTRLGEVFGEIPDDGATRPGGAAGADGSDAGASGGPTGDDGAGGPEPLVRVVRGTPDALELAALIAGLTAASAAAAAPEEAEAVRHRWTDRSHQLRLGDRGLPARGPDSWRWSLHP
ncbi:MULTISPECIES: acyl-CoA carboxylase subunit epsilon [Miniimonas]|uniref:acyl-CoA carboxylase subunit epsilon n=1 Tax=Miniimonas TaxID=947525 RepID=UPI001F3F59FB|nr:MULTISPECIES: acyl-CoA carboxylase subunit epsilon [Miniimonas]